MITERSQKAGSYQTLTVVIPTYNAAEIIGECLASVEWADEIIVVDMHSTDGTQAICASHAQCRVIQREDYIFGNVNHGFDQATSDWVMRLDTDERITPELREEIQAFIAAPPPGVTGMACWERPVILGRELRHGFGSPHHRRILFRRGAARYPVRGEHEDLATTGTWVNSRHGYIHLNYRTVGQYLQKTDYYTDRDVERAPVPAAAPPTWRGARAAAWAFYHYYLQRRGYRDGWVGFLDAAMRAHYQLVLWAKLRERYEASNTNS